MCENINTPSETTIQTLKYLKFWKGTVFPPLNSFLPWILAALQVPKKNSCRGNYMRKYGIQTWFFKNQAQINKGSMNLILPLVKPESGSPTHPASWKTWSSGTFEAISFVWSSADKLEKSGKPVIFFFANESHPCSIPWTIRYGKGLSCTANKISWE